MAIAAGTELPLRLTLRSDEEAHIRALIATTWAWVHLGGLGTRARRGLGSLAAPAWPTRAQKLPGGEAALPGIPNPASTGSPRELAAALQQVFRTFRTWGLHPTSQPEGPVYDLDLSRGARIVVLGDRGQPFQTWDRALDTIGERMRDFRRAPRVDGLPTHFLSTQPHAAHHAPHRAAFGLPLAYRGHGGQRVLLPKGAGKKGRMPSPLLVHLQAVRGGVLVVLTRLSGNLPGVHLDVVESGQGQGFLRADRTNNLLDRFLDSLSGAEVQP